MFKVMLVILINLGLGSQVMSAEKNAPAKNENSSKKIILVSCGDYNYEAKISAVVTLGGSRSYKLKFAEDISKEFNSGMVNVKIAKCNEDRNFDPEQFFQTETVKSWKQSSLGSLKILETGQSLVLITNEGNVTGTVSQLTKNGYVKLKFNKPELQEKYGKKFIPITQGHFYNFFNGDSNLEIGAPAKIPRRVTQ